MIEKVYGIEYYRPKVTLLKESGIGVAEIAARTCYDSFENSENECIQTAMIDMDLEAINGIENSALLEQLAWVHHHHSIIEHATLSFLIQGMSRGVLQEHARHRLQNISVRSTRYTMSNVINAFMASFRKDFVDRKDWFIEKVMSFDMLVTASEEYNKVEWSGTYDKLFYQYEELGEEEFIKIAIAKSSIPFLSEIETAEELFKQLQGGKKKRNVGDAFKHIVTDNWKVDLVVTFNIRSLKNYFDLRDSGAAYFQIKWLAEEMKKVTPVKYLRLIDKKHATNKR